LSRGKRHDDDGDDDGGRGDTMMTTMKVKLSKTVERLVDSCLLHLSHLKFEREIFGVRLLLYRSFERYWRWAGVISLIASSSRADISRPS